MSSIISEESIKIIKATAPVVAEHVLEITTTFYAKLLGRHPELHDYFNETNQRTERQPKALSSVIGGALPPCVEKLIGGGEGTADDKSKVQDAPQQAKTLGDAVVAYAQNIDKLDKVRLLMWNIATHYWLLEQNGMLN